LIYQSGDPDWFRIENDEPSDDIAKSSEAGKSFDAPVRYYQIALTSASEEYPVESIAPSSLKDADVDDLTPAQLWKPEINQGAVLGKLVHRWMEEIRDWVEDGIPSKKQLVQLANATMTQDELSQVRVIEWADRFGTYLEKPEVRVALSRVRYEPWHQGKLLRLEVSRERRLLQQFHGRLVRGSIDRCVLGYDGDRVIRGEVLDFKIDQCSAGQDLDAWIADRIREHSSQLQLYGNVLRQQYALRPEQLELTLVLLSVGRVVSIPMVETDPLADATSRTQIL
jgi:hypothetical protein